LSLVNKVASAITVTQADMLNPQCQIHKSQKLLTQSWIYSVCQIS